MGGGGGDLREGRAEGKVVLIDGVMGLLKIKVIIAVDGRSHGNVSIVEMLGNVQKLVTFILWVGREARKVECGSARGGRVREVGGDRAHAARSKAIEEGGTMIV